MKNLETALTKAEEQEKVKAANELFNLYMTHTTALRLAWDMNKFLGGFSNGSDVYDNDKDLALTLLEAHADYSLDDDDISTIKEEYAGMVLDAKKDKDYSSYPGIPDILKLLETDRPETTTEEVIDMLKYSSKLADRMYALLSEPRG